MLINDKVMMDLDGSATADIRQVIRDEIDPNYSVNIWCGHCVAEMVKLAFKQID